MQVLAHIGKRGRVFLIDLGDIKHFALKVCDQEGFNENEFELGSNTEDSNILKTHGQKTAEGRYLILQEHANLGSLEVLLELFPEVPRDGMARAIVLQLLKGINSLHEQEFVHNGISIEHVLFSREEEQQQQSDEEGQVKAEQVGNKERNVLIKLSGLKFAQKVGQPLIIQTQQ
ncbi:MAG: hypothetical protein EZS28_039018, partial [Streblomastix strix]